LGALGGATQATAVEERTTKKAKSGPTKTAKSVGMSKKSDEIIYMPYTILRIDKSHRRAGQRCKTCKENFRYFCLSLIAGIE
jgi:hypothetical protein